jgi:hypothetical protein
MSDLKELRARAKKLGWLLTVHRHSAAPNGTKYYVGPKSKVGKPVEVHGGSLQDVERAIDLKETTGYM